MSWLLLLVAATHGWLDFSAFYAAGRLAFSPAVLDLGGILAFQARHGLPQVPFLYPPAFALAYVPFANLPYDVAAVTHLLVQFGILLLAAVLGARLYGLSRGVAVLGTLAWLPAVTGVVTGQNSALLLLLALAAAIGLGASEISEVPLPHVFNKRGNKSVVRVTGVAVGAAAYRPHLGLPLLALAAWRGPRAVLATAGVVILIQYVLGIVATGGMVEWPLKWLTLVGAETGADFANVGWQVIGIAGVLSRLAPAESAASRGLFIVGATIGVGLVLASLQHLRRWDAPRAVALTCALALFAGPRGWTYDATLLLPAVAVLAADAASLGWPQRQSWLLAGLYACVLAAPLGALIGFNPAALAVLAAPFALISSAREREMRALPGLATAGR